MNIGNDTDAVEQIKKEYNFWGGEMSSVRPYPKDQIHNAYFSGEPEILESLEIKGHKVWKYRWPEQPEVPHWLLENGEKIDDEVDVEPMVDLIYNLRPKV